MNWNAIRTVFALVGTALTGIITFAPSFLGCTVDEITSKYDCTNSWLPVEWAAGVAFVLYLAALIAKATTQGGTVTENLGNKTVPVTPVDKQGTVTPTQVNSGVPTK